MVGRCEPFNRNYSKLKKLYVAYGSNMNILQMRHRCPAAEKICTEILKDYQLEFRGVGVATIIPEPDQKFLLFFGISLGDVKKSWTSTKISKAL